MDDDSGDILVRAGFKTRGLFASMRPGRLLDIPAGGGIQSRALAAMGYDVVSADLFPGESSGATISVVRADANQAFPFRASSFDYVLSREGIEHLENQTGFLRECARVLKPGGTIVITTPNLMHLSARVSMFLTAQRNMRRGLINEVQTLRGRTGPYLYHGHAFMLDYFRMRYMMRVEGFESINVFTDHYSPTSIALVPIVPILWLAMRYSAAISKRQRKRKSRTSTPDAVASEIIRHVLSPAMLFGKRMIVTAVRSANSKR
ncbi:MAG TPA: methyltransferase domain-containing protein [Candidatus Binataceae bacterium]|nr:methyltransferase domain-containing protein [Candidatus Binataceae bacterium]